MPIAARASMPFRLLVVAALGLAAVLSGCDATPGPIIADEAEGVRQVTVVGKGEVQGVPDTLTINASMEIIAPDAAGALNQTSQRQRAVIDALVGLGIDRKDVSTTQISVQPQYPGYDSNTIVGYRANNSIDVKVRQLDQASQVFTQIATAGGNAMRVNNVTLAIEDDSQLVREARSRAFNDAKSRAEQYALLAELDLGQVISISEVAGTPPPVPLPTTRDGAAEMAAVPIEPGQQTVDFSVTVVWELTSS